MGALTKTVVSATGAMASSMASGMSQAIGATEKEGNKIEKKMDEDIQKALPEVDEKIIEMISDMRKDFNQKFENQKSQIEPLLKDPIFENGPKIVDKYEFDLPKLTEELDDKTIAKYMILFIKDENFGKMFKEIMTWMNTLPKPEEKPKEENSDESVPEDIAKEMDNEED